RHCTPPCLGRSQIYVDDMKRPRILVISFSDLSRDPRVDRQIRFLVDSYDVVVAGWTPPSHRGAQFIPIKKPTGRSFARRLVSLARLLSGRFESYYWRMEDVQNALGVLEGENADLVLANELDTLPLAFLVSKGAPVFFDAHEFAPLEFEDLWTF